MTPKKISVLVVDDSAFMRKALKRMLGSDPLIEVAGLARDGEEALAEARRLRPDVITLDVQMPGMDGLTTLRRIMLEQPTPVLMVSSLTSEGGALTLQALAAGAVDFIDKSTCHTTMDIIEIADALVEKVKVLAGVDLNRLADTRPAAAPSPPPAAAAPRADEPSHLVAIGASTGGPMSLERVLTAIPADYPGAILVVQHMPVGFTRSLAERMNQICPMHVKEAQEDDPVTAGHVFIGAAGHHLRLRGQGRELRLELSRNSRDSLHVPSVDVMMQAVAQQWPGRMLGVVLTGMGNDGAEGVKAMKARQATILAQNEETCVVFGMPKAAAQTGAVDRLLSLDQIAEEIKRFR